MLRFYPQYKLEDFENMDVKTFRTLHLGMTCLKAEENLYSMEVASYPHMDDKNRRKTHKRYYKNAYPENFEKRTVKTSELQLV
jgi:hypothetical protein